MWDFDQPCLAGKLIAVDEAWRRLDEWRTAGKEIGALYVAKSGSVRALGFVEAASRGRLALRGSKLGATFDLKKARFAYYSTQIYPRWPLGPAMDVMALHAFLESGEWLMLAEKSSGITLAGLRRIGEG